MLQPQRNLKLLHLASSIIIIIIIDHHQTAISFIKPHRHPAVRDS
jgi:hypothetical protein